jgi:hypothetical protein
LVRFRDEIPAEEAAAAECALHGANLITAWVRVLMLAMSMNPDVLISAAADGTVRAWSISACD